MQIEFSNIDYSFSPDPELNILSGHGTINIFLDDVFEKEETIGSLSFNVYNGKEFDSDQEILISSDAVSGDEVYMIQTLFDSDFDSGKIITLDRINIIEKYNSVEVELQILEAFINFCNYLDFDYILVIAANPISKGGKRIVEFPQLKPYKELGFEKLGGTDRLPVMIKILGED